VADTDNLPMAANTTSEHSASTAPVVSEHSMEPPVDDRVTVAPSVLLTMVRLGALSVEGVKRMGNTPGGVNEWLRRTPAERGVRARIDGQTVMIDAYIVVDADSDLRDVCRKVQRQVARDIEENIGMQVGAVNIHIEDVVFAS
jgi:uncharacterized alkaline shock family protein YloU